MKLVRHGDLRKPRICAFPGRIAGASLKHLQSCMPRTA